VPQSRVAYQAGSESLKAIGSSFISGTTSDLGWNVVSGLLGLFE
jgi:hypothetical protein